MSKKLVEEIIWEQLAPILEELAPSDAATLQEQEQEKVGVFDKTQSDEAGRAEKKGFLDVRAIVSKLVSRSTPKGEGENENELNFSAVNAIEIIRRSVHGGTKPTSESSVQDIHNYFMSFFQQPKTREGEKVEECTDIGTLANRALVNSAYHFMLTHQSSEAAGKTNEVFLANLIGGSAIKPGTRFEKADVEVSNIADFMLEDQGLYFSLKTRTADREYQGSVTDLLAALGIPYIFKKYNKEGELTKTFLSGKNEPVGRFFIVSLSKPKRQATKEEDRFFSLAVVEIKKENIVNLLKKAKVGKEKISEQLKKRKEDLANVILDKLPYAGRTKKPVLSNDLIEYIMELGKEGEDNKTKILNNLDELLESDAFNRYIEGADATSNTVKGAIRIAYERYKSISQYKDDAKAEYFVLDDRYLKGIFKGLFNSLSSEAIRQDKIAGQIGVDQYSYQKLDFKVNQEALNQQTELLEEKLTYSLNLINEYFMSIEKLILEYASRPSYKNLEAFKAKAIEIGNQSITTIEKVFECDDQNPLDKPS